jgi:hypothetical protein
MVDFNKIRKQFNNITYDFKIPYSENTKTKPNYIIKIVSCLGACWFSGSHKTNKKQAIQEIINKYKNVKYENLYFIELYKIHNTGKKDILNNTWYQWKKIDNLNKTTKKGV